MSHIFRSLIAVFVPFSFSLAAQPSSSSRLSSGERPAARSASATGSLTLFNSEYVSARQIYFRGEASDHNRGVAASLEWEKKWRKFSVRLNGHDEYSATEQWNYADVYEAYLRWQSTGLHAFSFGRKLERWNEWEKEWRQGVFQPRYMENRLRSHEAGLVGVFYNQDTRPLSLTIGFLPVAIPDFGAHHSVEDGRFVSKNPWFMPPARQFEFRQVVSDIRYSIDKPTLEEAVLHPGGVAKLELNGMKNYFARLSAAYKPMPQFLFGFPSRGRVIITSSEDYMSVHVTPRLPYHALFSHDSIFQAGPWTFSGGLTREVPDEDRSIEDHTAQQVAPATIYSASVSRPLEAEGPYAARLKIGFLKVDGDDAPDQGDFAGGDTLFERRYQFNEAYSLGLTKPWRAWGRFPLDTEFRLVYDRLQNGGIATLVAGMNFSPSFRADVQMDFLGLLNGPAAVEDGFLALYRANDRVGFGLSYVY